MSLYEVIGFYELIEHVEKFRSTKTFIVLQNYCNQILLIGRIKMFFFLN